MNLVQLIYDKQTEIEVKRDRVRKPHHYPSSACGYGIDGEFMGACRRATWFSWNNMPRECPQSPALFKMATGDLIHDYVSNILDDVLGLPTLLDGEERKDGAEIPLKWQADGMEYPFSGRLDGRYSSHGFGVEMKTIYGRAVTDIKNNGVKNEALLQCAIYLSQDVVPIDEIKVIYICRDSGLLMQWDVKFEEISHKDVLHRVLIMTNMAGKCIHSTVHLGGILEATKELEVHVTNNTIPRKDYEYDIGWRCNYCDYKSICKEVIDVE
jgi:CRISPR/Cas system-associated exonuclease Cas4 (RecB family)